MKVAKVIFLSKSGHKESDEELRHSGEGDHHDGPPGGLSQ